MSPTIRTFLLLVTTTCLLAGNSQPVTGVWRGRVTKGNGLLKQSYKVEVKLVKNGDSITGTSYYYASASNYYRYSVKGYFGAHDNSINWWDDQLIESHLPNLKLGNINTLLLQSVADYNCPGSGVMLLDGSTHPKEGGYQYDLHLQKMEHPDFKDEWDPIIETYFVGGADPQLIDSVGQIAFAKPPSAANNPTSSVDRPKETTVFHPPPVESKPVVVAKPELEKQPAATVEKEPELVANPWKKETEEKPLPVVIKEAPPAQPVVINEPKPMQPKAAPLQKELPPAKETAAVLPRPEVVKTPPTVEDKFARRKTVLNTTIPVVGDSLVFKFYDNAEVDGDSISIFLNGKMLYTHIRLTDKGYSVKISVASLQPADNQLVMVAENLGSIPPNTAYMEAWSGGKRYTARMESTEHSSAMIVLKKE